MWKLWESLPELPCNNTEMKEIVFPFWDHEQSVNTGTNIIPNMYQPSLHCKHTSFIKPDWTALFYTQNYWNPKQQGTSQSQTTTENGTL